MADTNRKLTLELEVKPPQPGQGFDRMANDARDAVRQIQEELRRTSAVGGGAASMFGTPGGGGSGGGNTGFNLSGLEGAQRASAGLAASLEKAAGSLLQLTRGLAVMGASSGGLDAVLGKFLQMSSYMDVLSGGVASIRNLGGMVGGVLSSIPIGFTPDRTAPTSGWGGAVAAGGGVAAAGGAGGGVLNHIMGRASIIGTDAALTGTTRTLGGWLGRAASRVGAGALGFGGAVLGGLGAAIALNSSETAQNWAAERAPNWLLNFGNRWSNMTRGHGFTDREGDRGVVNLAQSNADLARARARRDFRVRFQSVADAFGSSASAASLGYSSEDFLRSSGSGRTDVERARSIGRMREIIEREDKAARLGAVRAPWEARERALSMQRVDLLGQERGIDIEVTGALADRSFGRTQSEFQRLMGRGMAADASASDRAAYQSSFAEMERQFGDMRTGSGSTRAAVMRANLMVGEARAQRGSLASQYNSATTNADKVRLANELVQAQERVTQATQQQVQANRQLREAEIGRLENYRQLVAQAHNLARANADAYRRQTRQQGIGLALGGQDMQENALHISQRLRQVVDSGQGELTQDELAFAQGNEMFRPLLERYGERMAAGNPYIAEIQRNLGRPEEQARLDTEAGRLGTRERELNDRIGRAMEDNARDFQRDIQDALRPEMENMGRMLALGLTASLREHMFRLAVEVFRAEFARVMAGFPGGGA